jgi:hypothetical protein
MEGQRQRHENKNQGGGISIARCALPGVRCALCACYPYHTTYHVDVYIEPAVHGYSQLSASYVCNFLAAVEAIHF